jgi:hypothetical protein
MMDIGTLICNALVETIIAACQTPYSDNPGDSNYDAARVKLVKKGMFQDDPTENTPIVCVERNNRSESWYDERMRPEMGVTVGRNALEQWYRRFTVTINVWPAGKLQDAAESINSTVVGRVKRAVTDADVSTLADEFGERVTVGINPITMQNTREMGGPDDEYAWQTVLFLEYQTEYVP